MAVKAVGGQGKNTGHLWQKQARRYKIKTGNAFGHPWIFFTERHYSMKSFCKQR